MTDAWIGSFDSVSGISPGYSQGEEKTRALVRDGFYRKADISSLAAIDKSPPVVKISSRKIRPVSSMAGDDTDMEACGESDHFISVKVLMAAIRC